MSEFYYQIGPVVTTEHWEFPTNEMINDFLKEYVPEFKRIFNESSTYELYFLGNSADRYYNRQNIEQIHSDDVDLNIMTTTENPDEEKIFDAMSAAVKIGFKHKILIDIVTKKKPYYLNYEYDKFITHKILNPDVELYKLNPQIYKTENILRETYIKGIKDVCIVKCICSKSKRFLAKIRSGWICHKPTLIS